VQLVLSKHLPALAVLLFLALQTACSPAAPTWRTKATLLVDELVRQDAQTLFPQEYHNLLETFEHGEAVFHVQGDEKASDTLYLLTLQKGELLRDELHKRKQRREQEERQRVAAEAAQAEEERLLLQAAEAEAKFREQELRSAALEAQAAAARRETPKEARQHLAIRYTVRRGETLPQIAARSEIYNDSSLWPLIYRANRDQIRDPRQLWPGQVLKIPRHFTRDEALEAKRYSGNK
jgi:hypothetical protein